MRAFGYEVSIRKAAPMSNVLDNRGGWFRIFEPFAGAWQRDIEWTTDGVLAHAAVYACITLISNDVGKLRQKLVVQDEDGIWSETTSAAFTPVLRKPNRFQNHIQFKEWWITSKLISGNTYALKVRDNRGVVRELYLLDPQRVTVLVSDDGRVFYRLNGDNLSGVDAEGTVVPASEIIHDRMNCLFHPLVGISPIWACGMAANIGIRIEGNSATFFGRGSNPSGILTAPGIIDQPKADEISTRWNRLYSGENSGKVAVLGNGLEFTPLRMSAADSQLIEQLKWTDEAVCRAFHVPAFKVGVGQMPTYQNGETLNQIYYSDCLQSHIEQYEAALDEGLNLLTPTEGRQLGIELDLDGLLRMDTATQVKTMVEGLKGLYAPNEARRKVDLPPVDGGDSPMIQQQNFSLAALAKRDAQEDPFASVPPSPAPSDEEEDDGDAEVARTIELRARTLRLKAVA